MSAAHVRFSYEHRDIDMDVVHGFLRDSYWSPGIRRDVLERAIGRSLVVVALADEGGTEKQIGFTRIVTDGATFALVCDVFVLEPWRGKGIATLMLEAAERHPEITSLRRWLLATRDAHALYASCGYAPLVEPARWMERRPDPAQWQDREPGG
ncbi:MAG: GNAT family N-acetyltransferase [Phycisphaerales bacterium]